jgi:flagellar hook-basal body complex protein FliE
MSIELTKITGMGTPMTVGRLQIDKPHDSSHQPFSDFLSDCVQDTNTRLLTADEALQDLAKGHSVNLHQTMLTLEEAKLSFQLLEQVRNRLMSAYQDILREQI